MLFHVLVRSEDMSDLLAGRGLTAGGGGGDHTFETSPVCTEHRESSAHWPALPSLWETVLGQTIGSGRVNNEDDGNGQCECQRSAGYEHLPQCTLMFLHTHKPHRTQQTCLNVSEWQSVMST